jgi:calmodulin
MNTKDSSRSDKSKQKDKAPAYKHMTPIKGSNVVVAGAQNRNIAQMSQQLAQTRSNTKFSSPQRQHGGTQNNMNSPQKKKVTFSYPKFSRSEYQQQFMKENTTLSDGEDEYQSSTVNSNGAVIERSDIEQAFKFFDVHKRNRLTAKDLRQRLKVFYPNMSNNEYKFLISDNNFTLDKLIEILESNVLTNYDPYKEAFKIFDPNDTGYIDTELLGSIMTQLGYGAITLEDLSVLISTADVDGDGRISLDDFRLMLSPAAEQNNIKSDQ